MLNYFPFYSNPSTKIFNVILIDNNIISECKLLYIDVYNKSPLDFYYEIVSKIEDLYKVLMYRINIYIMDILINSETIKKNIGLFRYNDTIYVKVLNKIKIYINEYYDNSSFYIIISKCLEDINENNITNIINRVNEINEEDGNYKFKVSIHTNVNNKYKKTNLIMNDCLNKTINNYIVDNNISYDDILYLYIYYYKIQ